MAINLITDRTLDDVIYQEDLRQAIINRTATVEQWREWLKEMRGRNDVYTLNRVGQAMIEVARPLPVRVTPKIDWKVEDIPTPTQAQHYLDNIKIIRSTFEAFIPLPLTPATLDNLTFEAANDIEQILYDIWQAILPSQQILIRSGDIFSYSGDEISFKETEPLPMPDIPVIITDRLQEMILGIQFKQVLEVIDDSRLPSIWLIESGKLPDGIDFAIDGVLSGIPESEGNFIFTVKAVNVAGSDTKTFSVSIGKYTSFIRSGDIFSYSGDEISFKEME